MGSAEWKPAGRGSDPAKCTSGVLGGSGGDPHQPLQQEQTAESDEQEDEESFRTGHQPQSAAGDADPAPGDLHRTQTREDERGSVRPHGRRPLAPHKVGETGRRPATGTWHAGQHADGARRQSELLMRPITPGVGGHGGRHCEPRDQQQAPSPQQHLAAGSERKPATQPSVSHFERGDRVDNGTGRCGQGGLHRSRTVG